MSEQIDAARIDRVFRFEPLDQVVQKIGAVLTPVYPTISVSELEFVLNDAAVKLVFVKLVSVTLFKTIVAPLTAILVSSSWSLPLIEKLCAFIKRTVRKKIAVSIILLAIKKDSL